MIGAARGPQGRSYQLLSTNTYTTGGTQSYTIPNGARYLHFQMWGGGGGGGPGRTVGTRPGLRYGGGGGMGGDYAEFFFYGGDGRIGNDGPCDNFDMQAGDVIEFVVGYGGTGPAAGTSTNGSAGGTTKLISHKRSGSLVLDHDAVTGWTELDEWPATYLCDSSYLYSCLAAGGQGGLATSAIPSGQPSLLPSLVYYPERRVGQSYGVNGTNNSGNTTDCYGGTGGAAGGTGGQGGTGGKLSPVGSVPGSTGSSPGGGGGGGAATSTNGNGKGGQGAAGQVIIRAYG